MKRQTVLVVEDTVDFQDVYRRHIERAQAVPFVADSLAAALDLVNRVCFAAALVDIRLSEADDQNVDGLTVLEALSKSGDGTKAVVITGHGSFTIARDAMLRYGAFDALEKADLSPTVIQAKIEGALDAYNAEFARAPFSPNYVLKPAATPVWKWEHEVLTVCTPLDGARGLYMFLDRFVRQLAPLIPLKADVALAVDRERGFCEGVFWSRGVGKASLVRIGPTEAMKREPESVAERQGFVRWRVNGGPAATLEVGEVFLTECTYGVTGAAYEVRGLEPSAFGLVPQASSVTDDK
jgi:ActR/RegA family two-component response regulator